MAQSDEDREQQKAQAAVEDVRLRMGPFVIAVEKTRMAMAFTNAKTADHRIIFANPSFLQLTGYDRESVLGKGLSSLMADGTSPQALQQLEAGFAGVSDKDPEIHYKRPDGSDFWAAVFVSPVQDVDGTTLNNFVSLIDLTKYKLADINQQMLIDELNHRVKNMLSTVQSIIREGFRKPHDIAMIRETIEARLFALSRSHDLLNKVDWRDADLRQVVEAALEPFLRENSRGQRIEIVGDDIEVRPKVALALGIAFHELATNAVKYGSLSNGTGTVRVSWKQDRESELELVWEEKEGPAVSPPSSKGFGSQVIERGLAMELQGSVDLSYRPEGVVCTIAIPAQGGLRGD